jgi:hypothetical protein
VYELGATAECAPNCARARPFNAPSEGRTPYDAGTVGEKAIRRAALITLRRVMCERYAPGAPLEANARRYAALAQKLEAGRMKA